MHSNCSLQKCTLLQQQYPYLNLSRFVLKMEVKQIVRRADLFAFFKTYIKTTGSREGESVVFQLFIKMFKGEFKIGGVAAVVEGGAGLFDFFVRGMGVIGVIEEEEV